MTMTPVGVRMMSDAMFVTSGWRPQCRATRTRPVLSSAASPRPADDRVMPTRDKFTTGKERDDPRRDRW